MIRQLAHVCLSSPSIPETVAFYTSVLGCAVVHEFKNNAGVVYGVFLSAGNGTSLEFFNVDTAPPPGGLFRHLCFQVDDIQQTADALRARGLQTEVKRSRSDHTLQCWITDPHGTMIEFHQHDPQSAHVRPTTG